MLEADKNLTAKLLATENITVVQEKVSTASFDVKNRVLRLPLWTDTTADTLDHLIGHEVGHALYTPLDGWHDAVCEKGVAYKSYLNVIEDARIEKLIQRKYPGLRSSFIKSYRKLLADGFFGGSLDDINKMGLIDRINVYFKCGQSAGIKFDIAERDWLNRIETAETWEDVVSIADELFAFEKEKAEQRREEQQQQANSSDYEDDEEEEFEDDSWGDASESDGEMDEFDELFQDASSGLGDSEDDEEEDESEDESENYQSMAGGRSGNAETDIESKTDSALREAIDRELNSAFDGEVVNLRINDRSSNYHQCIVSYKELLENPHRRKKSNYEDSWQEEHDADRLRATTAYGEACYNYWLNNNKRHVMHMVKEFEMRKRASEYARTQTSKTGVIDTLKMNNYKFSDDIFKKVNIVPEGKNHGFIMYLDMSGSMADYMYQTVEQVMLLAHFCHQINVPYRVYGFSNATVDHWNNYNYEVSLGETVDCQHVELLELFTNNMKKSEMVKMSQYLLGSYIRHRATRCRRKVKDVWFNRIVNEWNLFWRDLRLTGLPFADLSGTPLNHALINAIPLAIDFRKSHRIDVLNTFFLTDGESHPLEWKVVNPEGNEGRSTLRWLGGKAFVYINDPYTGLRVGERGVYVKETETLLAIYRRATGSNVIGYRIDHRTRRNLDWFIERNVGGWSASDDQWAEYRTQGYVKVESKAYDDLFLIADSALEISDNNMEDVKAGDSKAKLRRAFSKSKTDGKKSRKMVVDLMKRVA